MIELEKISLKNIIVHKNSSIELQNGITVIRGDNGSGKSLLFNCLPNVFDGCPPLLKKKDAKVIHTDNSAIGIKYKFNNKQYRVIQKSKNSNISYDIEEDGVNLQPRTISMAKEMLEKIFPLSTSHYYSLVHLNTYRPSILLSGTGPQRKEFFEELFHLNISDYILDEVKEKFNSLKRLKDEKEVLENQLKELTYIENIDELKDKFKTLSNNYDELNEKYLDYIKKIQVFTSIKTYKSQLNTQFSKDELKEKIQDFQRKLDNINNRKTQLLVDIDIYNKNLHTIKKREELVNKLKDYNSIDFSSDSIKELYQKGKEDLLKGQQELEDAKINQKKFEEFSSLDKNITNDIRKKTFEEYLGYIGKQENSIEEKELIIKNLESLDGEKICPTCQQVLNEKTIESLKASLSNDIIYLGMEVQNKSKVISWFKLKDIDFKNINIEELESNLESLRNSLRDLKEKFSKAQEKERLELELKSFPKILELEEPNQDLLNQYDEKLKVGKNKLAILESDLRIQLELEKLKDTSNEDIDSLTVDSEKLSIKLNELNTKRMELNSKIKLGESQNSLYIDKTNRIKDIESLLIDFPIYEALTKAYGAKGIKIDQINYLAQAFCKNLNKYANLVYNKRIKFTINVDSTNFNILAERNGYSSDVCMLSGAESRCFQLLCLLSLLPFIPEKYRTDFIILDELEAGIQESGRHLLTQGFFKTLLNIVPKIIVITPMSTQEYYIEANKQYYLRLKDNATVMEEII